MPLAATQSTLTSNHRQAGAALQRNCAICGFQNLAADLRCQKCGRHLPPAESVQSFSPNPPTTAEQSQQNFAADMAAIPQAAPAPLRQALPEHVRKEIHAKVERFKARRRGQTLPLPFEEPVLAEPENIVPFPTLEPEPAIRITRAKPAREARVNILAAEAAVQDTPASPTVAASFAPEMPSAEPVTMLAPLKTAEAVAAAAPVEPAPIRKPAPVDLSTQVPLFVPPSEQASPQWQNFRIATIRQRAQGIGHDLGCMLGGVALFAAPFYWIAGKPALSPQLLAAFLCGALIITLLYGTLFLAVMGETPGMTAAGLRIVSFSGQPASLPQKLLRVAGAMVSTGSFLFGFLWAFVDEEKLCWHDHISKTVLTDTAE